MKKWIILTTLASALALSVIAFAEPGERRDGNSPRSMRGLPGPQLMQQQKSGMVLERILKSPEAIQKLGLTDEQVAALKDLHLNTAKATIPLRAEAELATLELRESLSQGTVDQSAVMAAIDRVHQARAELQKTEVRSRLASREILGSDAMKQIQARMRDRMSTRMEAPERLAPMERPVRPGAGNVVRPRR